MGNAADVTLSNVIAAIWSLVETTERGLSFPLSLLVTIGVISSIFRRRRERLWLIPPLGLFLLFVGAATSGSLLVKWQYTVTYGLLLMPFLAYSCYVLGVEQWPRSRFVAAIAGLILLVAVSTIEPLWKGVPGGGQFFARAAPDFWSQTQAAEVLSLVNAGRTAGHDALVTDFYGWRPSYYVALHTMLHPDRICTTNGAPNVPLDVAGFRDFLAEHPKGVLITQDRGRLTSLLHRQPDGSVKLENLALQIEPLGEVLLPLPGSADDIVIGVGRYTVMGSANIRMGRSTASDRCASSCVTDLCRRD